MDTLETKNSANLPTATELLPSSPEPSVPSSATAAVVELMPWTLSGSPPMEPVVYNPTSPFYYPSPPFCSPTSPLYHSTHPLYNPTSPSPPHYSSTSPLYHLSPPPSVRSTPPKTIPEVQRMDELTMPAELRTVLSSSIPFYPKPARRLPNSVRTQLSFMMREIHSSVFEEHRLYHAPLGSRGTVTKPPHTDESKSAPTADEIIDVFGINAAAIPEMSVQDISGLVKMLFPKPPYLSEVFVAEQIDGQGILLLNYDMLRELLKLPLGPAVVLDGILKRVREIRSIAPPID